MITYRETVGDRQGSTPLGQIFQSFLNVLLRRSIEGTSSLVEQKNGRVLQQGPGDSHTLFLPTTQPDTTFSNLGLVTVGEAQNPFVHLSGRRRSYDFFVRGAEPAITNVVLDARVEQDTILRNDTDCFPQTGLSDIPDILTIDQDSSLAFFKIVEPVKEP